ncbi:MAG: hypothetical protein Q7J16_07455 [Candidatus Cloacimonadales bacterium]|nr:hypothetical protein [Candidatus Cloacimonadales bacterium]
MGKRKNKHHGILKPNHYHIKTNYIVSLHIEYLSDKNESYRITDN